MEFKLDSTFEQNLSHFKTEIEKVDAECAKILFDNLHLLDVGNDAALGRGAIGEFHKTVLSGLDALQKATGGKS